jgi:hypothetical protein
MTHGVDLAAHLPGNLDGVESWNKAIQALDALLKESGTILCAILHKYVMTAQAMQTCLSSLATYPTIDNGVVSSLLADVTKVYKNSRP